MIQSVIIIYQILFIYLKRRSYHINDGDRHVTDVDNTGVRTQLSARLGYDRRRIGVVQNPVGGFRVFLHIINHFDHGEDGTHAVCHSAAAAGLLSHAAMLQRDLLILLSHSVFSHTHLSKDEVRVRIGFFLIIGYGKLDPALQILFQNPFYQHAQLVLTLSVDVKETDLVYFQLVLAERD